MTLPGEADGSLGPAVSTALPPGQEVVLEDAADLNDDGKLDLVGRPFGGSAAQVEAFLGNGAGGFSGQIYSAEQGDPYYFAVAVADFNLDGHPDIATVGSQLAVLGNSGAGVFSPILQVPIAPGSMEALAADVNGDSRPDLVLASQSGVSVLLNQPPQSAPLPMDKAAPRRPAVLHIAWKLSRRAPRGRRSLRVSGRLILPAGLQASSPTCSGRVLIELRSRGRTLARTHTTIRAGCLFNATLSVGGRELNGGPRPTVLVSYAGNTALLAGSARRRL